MSEPASVPGPSTSSRLLRISAFVVVLALLAFVGRRAGGEIPRFAEWVAGLGPLGPLVFIAGYALAVVAFVPASVLTLAAGAVFGIGPGVAYVFCAATLGSGLAFLVSRYVARAAIEQRLAGNAAFASIDKAIAREGRKIVFLLRLSPAFPFTLLNYAIGLTRVSFADYLLASPGMLPGTLLFVYYGKLAGDVAALAGGGAVQKGGAYYAVLALGLLATVAVTAVVTRTARRALAEATKDEGQASSPTTDSGRTTGLRHASRATAEASSHHSEMFPLDEHNRRLLDNVRPSAWKNPEPAPLYDLVVIGAGTGGLICAAVGAGLGARVALVERNLMGGDCLNFGCVPSKALLRAARRAAESGSKVIDDDVLDRRFTEAMESMRRIRADISRDDSASRYRDELGVDVFQGSARLTATNVVEVGDCRLHYKKAVVASGARAAVPDLPGLVEAGFVTNETVFQLVSRPRRFVVLGGGPIGCELAQAFRRLGCETTIVTNEARLLHREDADAGEILAKRLADEGIRVVTGALALAVSRGARGKVLHYRDAGGESEAVGDEILVATGRRPNVEGLGLGDAGIEVDAGGIRVDDHLRTANPRVFAVGDCCMAWKFTHAADAAAKIVVQNALFFGRKKLSDLVMPWCTYTDPEIAHVGSYESEARARGLETETFTVPLAKVNRAVCDGESEGFVRVVTKKGSDRILGATIVASHAGEMISEISLAIGSGLGLAKIAAVIHPYPTQAEGIKAAANAYMRTKLTPAAKSVLGLLLKLGR